MPARPDHLVAWIHPLLAAASLVLLFYVASLGLRSRERGGHALRPRHARLAPYALVAMLFNAVFGAVSAWLWRPDLERDWNAHLLVGIAIVVLLALAAWLSRRLPDDDLARQLHPLLGMLALLLASLQVFLGLPLLPL